MYKLLAKITEAGLNIKDHGILTFDISVDYEDGMSQVIGGLALDDYSVDKQIRVGTRYGCEMIRRILITLDVNDFSELVGHIIWVYGTGYDEGNFSPEGVGMLSINNIHNTPLIFDDVREEFSEVLK